MGHIDLNTYRPTPALLSRVYDPDGNQYDGSIRDDRPPGILFLDPGETTGWCMIWPELDYLTKDIITENWTEMHWGQVDCGARQGVLEDSDTPDALNAAGNGRNPEGEARGVARLLRLVDENPGLAVGAEDFIVDFRQITKARNSLSPVRITARIEQGLWDRGLRLHLQERSNPKVTMNDLRLKDLGVHKLTAGQPHARDAMRHALYFLRRCQNSAQLRHDAWPWAFIEPPQKVKKQRKKQSGQRIVFGD